MVASAQAGLTVDRVSVLVNGQSFRPREPGADASVGDGEYYETKLNLERRYVDKIREDVLLHVPHARVTVSIELEYSPDPDRIVEWVEEAYAATAAIMREVGVRGGG